MLAKETDELNRIIQCNKGCNRGMNTTALEHSGKGDSFCLEELERL